MITQQPHRRTVPSLATLAGACLGLLTFLASSAQAQTYRVVSLVPSGASSASDISEDGKVCGTKNTGSPGFVWMRGPDGSDSYVVREMALVPRAFSPSGAYIATDKGAYLALFGQVIPAPSSYATDLPSAFRAYSINDKAVLVGKIGSGTDPASDYNSQGYFRDLLKSASAWQAFGYFGKNFYDWTGGYSPAWFLNASAATSINNKGTVGGYALPNYPWGYGTSYTSAYIAPTLSYIGDAAAQWANGRARFASVEQGAALDVNENNVGAGFARAFSDTTCQFPAFFSNGPHEFRFLGASQTQWVIPNMKGCVNGLNDNNEGVGWSNKVGDTTGKRYPCLFVQSTGTVTDLNTLLEPRKVTTYLFGQWITLYFPSDWTVSEAVDINNGGDIAATAYYKGDSNPHAVLLKRL